MDYKKTGGARPGKNHPKHDEHNAFGTERTPYGNRPSKADLVAKLKAKATEAGKKKD